MIYKFFSILVFTLFFNSICSSQLINISKTELQEIKSSTLNFVFTDNLEYDSLLRFAVEEHWTFSKYKFISIDEYMTKRYSENEYFVSTSNYSSSMTRTETSVSSLTYSDYYKGLVISKGRKKPKKENLSTDIHYTKWLVSILNKQHTPTNVGDPVFVYDVVHKAILDVKSLQFLLKHAKTDDNINMKFGLDYKFPKIELCKKNTLYILKRDVNRKFNIEEIKKVYKFNVEVVTYKELEEKITSEEENALFFSWVDMGTNTMLTLVNISDGSLRFSWVSRHYMPEYYVFKKLYKVVK